MPLLTLSWPTRLLIILAFCPPFIVPFCLPGGKSKGRILNGAPLLSLVHFSPYYCCPVTEASAKHVYRFLLSESCTPPPPRVEKFRPQYGDLYWPSTWSKLFCFNLDHPVIDLSWKVAHGVLYTADRLIGFGYDIDATCFYNTALETPSHLFFLALSHKVPCPGFSLLCSPTPPLARLLSVVMYCLVLLPVSFVLWIGYAWSYPLKSEFIVD